MNVRLSSVLILSVFVFLLDGSAIAGDPSDQYIIRCETTDGDCDGWDEVTNSIIYETTTGLIGIGIVPSSILELGPSQAGGAGLEFKTYSPYGAIIETVSGSSAGHLYLKPASGYARLYDGSTSFIFDIYSGSTRKVLLNSNGQSYFNGGNVGIGTDNPIYKLEVWGTGKFTGQLNVEDISGGGWIATIEDITTYFGDFYGGGTIEIEDDNATKGVAGDWLGSSDQRLKTNIRPIIGALDAITSLRGVEFDWINPDEHGVQSDAGFIAQEVEQIFPNWVGEVEPDGADRNLIPQGEKAKGIGLPIAFEAYTVEAFRELRDQNQYLMDTVSDLEHQVYALKELVCADHPDAETCNQ